MEVNGEKYSRQIMLQGFGSKAQLALRNSKILVAGAGGLGCPASIYLSAAGVGHIGIIDFDEVELSNLPRQVLFNEKDLGKNKALVAVEKLKESYPDTYLTAFPEKLNPENIGEIIKEYDLVIDGTDNFATRYLLDEHCKKLNIPWVYASISQYESQICVWNYSKNKNKPIQYSDVFPVQPGAGVIENCAVAGVLGAVAGFTACLQVLEALKIITGSGNVRTELGTFHAWQNGYHEISLLAESPAQDKTLQDLRNELMQHDELLIQWLVKRNELVKEIGKIKSGIGMEPMQIEYWNKKQEHLLDMGNQYELPGGVMTQLLSIIHQWALDQQNKN